MPVEPVIRLLSSSLAHVSLVVLLLALLLYIVGLTHWVEGWVAGFGSWRGVYLSSGSGLRVSVFGRQGKTGRDARVHWDQRCLHNAV